MKLGLANIVVMYALFFMGPKQALVLDILKALFVFWCPAGRRGSSRCAAVCSRFW